MIVWAIIIAKQPLTGLISAACMCCCQHPTRGSCSCCCCSAAVRHAHSLPYPAPIRTGREPSAAGAATAAAAAAAAPRPSGSGQQGNNSNYQIPAHIPPGYVLSSPELYESPSAATRAYQRNTYTTSAGGCPVSFLLCVLYRPQFPASSSSRPGPGLLCPGQRWDASCSCGTLCSCSRGVWIPEQAMQQQQQAACVLTTYRACHSVLECRLGSTPVLPAALSGDATATPYVQQQRAVLTMYCACHSVLSWDCRLCKTPGGAGQLSASGAAASKSTAAATAAGAGAAAGSDSSAKGVSTSIAGAATLVSSSSDGQAGLSPLPLSTGVIGNSSSSPAGRHRVSWGTRTPLRKDVSWCVAGAHCMGV
jgi:hypothetical protein